MEDGLGDPDLDGMSNWAEYNAIDSYSSETDPTISSPQFYLTATAGTLIETPWMRQNPLCLSDTLYHRAVSKLLVIPEIQIIRILMAMDYWMGSKLIFTAWNSTDGVWTMNPLVPNDGIYDSDGDGIRDITELNLTSNLQLMGVLSPGAPTFGYESQQINQIAFENRLYRDFVQQRGKRLKSPWNNI